MNKLKFTVKYILPFVVVIQLFGVLTILKWDKAFQCKMWNSLLVCRQIKV